MNFKVLNLKAYTDDHGVFFSWGKIKRAVEGHENFISTHAMFSAPIITLEHVKGLYTLSDLFFFGILHKEKTSDTPIFNPHM